MLPHPVTFVCGLPEGYPDLFQASDDEPPDPDALKSYLKRRKPTGCYGPILF